MKKYFVSYYDKIGYKRGRIKEIEDCIFIKDKKIIQRIKNFRERIPYMTEEEQRMEKKTFPAFMVSCQCGEDKEKVIEQNNLICLDIDGLTPNRLTILKERLKKWKHTFATFRSIRGSGLAVIVRISEPHQFAEHYYSLSELFRKQGFPLDESCSNINRLRYVSFDEDIYINRESEPYRKLAAIPKKETTTTVTMTNIQDESGQLDSLIAYLINNRIDLTADPGDWRKIGSVLNHYYPSGIAEDLFIELSRNWPGDGKYSFSEAECRSTYRRRCSRFQIPKGVLFDIANKVAGIRYKQGEFVSY